jgi:hypothetical protein
MDEAQEQQMWARIVALESRAAGAESQIEALKIEVKQAQAQAALAGGPKAAAPLPAAWQRRLADHGIFLRPEDADEAQGSGTERYGSAGSTTWAERHDAAGAPN